MHYENNRVIAQARLVSVDRKRVIIVDRTSHPQYPMVWGRVCAAGKTSLVLLDPGDSILAESMTNYTYRKCSEAS